MENLARISIDHALDRHLAWRRASALLSAARSHLDLATRVVHHSLKFDCGLDHFRLPDLLRQFRNRSLLDD